VTGKVTVFECSPIYVSKCGSYKITGHMMCGARNGTFNVREWRTWKVIEGQEDKRLGTSDYMADAKMWAEWDINPDWDGDDDAKDTQVSEVQESHV
jgi:hypothetical protein